MSQLVGELVKSGQLKQLMGIPTLMSESTTFAESQLVVLQVQESGVTPPTQISDWNSALSQYVILHTNVREAIRWVPIMLES